MNSFSEILLFNKKIIFCFSILALFFLSSCHYMGLQRAYLPIQSVPNQLEEKGDQSVHAQISLSSIQLQYGRAISKGWGGSVMGYLGYQGQLAAGISAVQYKPLGNKWHWEFAGGYRFALNRSEVRNIASAIPFTPALYYANYYSQLSQVRYHELPLINHLVFKRGENVFWKKIGISLQVAPIWFDNYNFSNRLEEGGCLSCIVTTNHMYVQEVGALSVSPSVTTWFGSERFPMNLRIGGNWVSRIGSVRGTRDFRDPPTNQMFQHPVYVPVYVQFGISWVTNSASSTPKQ